MADRDPPEITLTTTTSAPISNTVTTTVAVGGRRNRPTVTTNRAAATADSNYLSPSITNPSTNRKTLSPNNDAEPFPDMPSPSPSALEATRTADYFPPIPTPARYQSQNRPIGIRRLPSHTQAEQTSSQRPRSGSLLTRRRTNTGPKTPTQENPMAGLAGLPGHYEIGTSGGMEPITEGQAVHHGQPRDSLDSEGRVGRSGSTRLRRASNAARSVLSKLSDDPHEAERLRHQNEYESDVVDYLDVLDPEVSTLTTLTNVQNAMFVPDIPFLNRYYNRRPTYELSRNISRLTEATEPHSLSRQVSRVTRKPVPATPRPPQVPPKDDQEVQGGEEAIDLHDLRPGDDETGRRASITSHVGDEHFAVLPHGVTLEGWSQEDVDALDDYVRHMLHSRRNRFKRGLKGFGKYIRKPLGFFVTLYAFLITIFGLIWVLFLIGWISLGERKDYIVNVIDNVLVALFAIMGDGLAPFRAIDTYHMIYIAHYHRLSWKIRKERSLPKLADHNDLPERSQKEVAADAEAGLEKESDADWEFSVLTLEQQRKLVHHQNKFSKSHSYYRPHETSTHYAFPLKLLIVIVSLLDAHSVLQIMLGSFTWGWSYHSRPGWITAVILSFSITVNITGGIVISIGDKRTRKKDVLLRMARQGLTEEAMRKVEKKKREEGEDVLPLRQTIDVTHALNVQQGVVEPKGNETKKGAEEVKAKLKGYRNPGDVDDSDGSSTRDLDKFKSNGFETESYRTASNGEQQNQRI